MKTSHPHKPLKILVLSAKGWGTGSALRAFYVAEALKKRGHQVLFPKPLPTWPLWLDMVLSTFYYAVLALSEPFDAVWCVKPYPTVVPACLIQRILGAKIVFDVDDLDWAYSHGAFRAFHRALQIPWPRWGAFATYHNPLLGDSLTADFGVPVERQVRVPQAVDLSIFCPGEPSPLELPPAARDWSGAKPLLVYTAHLNKACDLDDVLESFAIFRKKKPKAGLLVAGGGPDQLHFERTSDRLGVRDAVRFTGLIPPQQVAACLKIADTACAYYKNNEANRHRASLKLREALACGCRVAATKVGDWKEWSHRVVLSDPNPASFSQAIEQALKKPKPRPVGPSWDWKSAVVQLEKRLLTP